MLLGLPSAISLRRASPSFPATFSNGDAPSPIFTTRCESFAAFALAIRAAASPPASADARCQMYMVRSFSMATQPIRLFERLQFPVEGLVIGTHPDVVGHAWISHRLTPI